MSAYEAELSALKPKNIHKSSNDMMTPQLKKARP